MDSVSGIINEQKRFYRKIGTIFVFYVAVLCVVYPLIAKTDIPKPYIISFILILSVSTFAEYFFSLPYTSLISADQKIRISYIVSIVYTVVNILVALLWVSLKADIRLIYLSMCIIGLLRPLFYTLYVKKHYQLNAKAKPDETALNQRWNGMVHHFAFYIHTNTDSAILTVFIGTAMVSVYNVYSAIIFGVEKIITSVSTGVAAGLGNLIESHDNERINRIVDQFEFIQGGVATVIYTIAALLLIPFIRIYTADMTDVEYIQPIFGYALILAEVIYCFRCIYSTVSTDANKFKETQLGAILECVVNLAISLALVLIARMGILGVAVGTVIGMLTRYVFEILFLSKNVLYRPVSKAVRMLCVSILASSASIAICRLILDYSRIKSLEIWFVYAVITSFIVAAVALAVYAVFYRKTIKSLVLRLMKRG